MPKSITSPVLLLSRHKFGHRFGVPFKSQKRHVLCYPRIGHMSGNLCGVDF